MRTRLKALRAHGSDEGISLVELIVAVMISAIALTVTTGLFVNVSRSTVVVGTSRAASGVAANAIDELGRVVRAASTNPTGTTTPADPAVVSGTATSLTVISYIDTDPMSPTPSRVDFTVGPSPASNLTETRTAGVLQPTGYWSFTGAVTTRTISGPLDTGSPLFTYLDSAGAPVPQGSGFTLAQRQSIAAIRITVTVQRQGRVGSDPVQLTTTAALLNPTLS